MEQPFIAIDTRKGRIRINKSCYDLLMEPQFIKILINPATMQLGIQRTDKMSPEANRVNKADTAHGHADVYCRWLVHDLAARYHWTDGYSYRVPAEACVDNEVLVFPLRKMIMTECGAPVGMREETNEVQIEFG